MTRISDIALQQALLNNFQRTQATADATQIQLSSGRISETFGGLDGGATRLLSSESIVAQARSYVRASEIAANRFDVQNAALQSIDGAIASLSETLSRTLANGASELIAFDTANAARTTLAALNTQAGGVFVFGGDNGLVRPVDASSIDDLGGDIRSLFNNGQRITIGVEADGAVDGGPTADEIGAALLDEFSLLADPPAVLGAFQGVLTNDQRLFITERVNNLLEIREAIGALNAIAGVSEARAARALERNQAASDLAEQVAADIESVDIADAITRLNQDQLALQATAQALGVASGLSLLNFI